MKVYMVNHEFNGASLMGVTRHVQYYIITEIAQGLESRTPAF